MNGEGRIYKQRNVRRLPYPTMAVDAIAALNVQAVIAADAALLLWAPDVFVINGSATRVCEEWGFRPQRFLVWEKRGFGMGTFPRPQHELALFGKRGRLKPKRRDIGSVQGWKFVYESRGGSGAARRHSAKPPDFLAMVESVFDGPYLEMFSRSSRLGWTTFGNETPGDESVAAALNGVSMFAQEIAANG